MRTTRPAALLLAALALGLGRAQAAGPPPPPVTEAAAILSRFAAGTVPDLPAVHAAIDVLAEQGGAAELILLEHLAREEHDHVAVSATLGRARLEERLVQEQRDRFDRQAPSPTEAEAWARSRSGTRSGGASGDPALAYAALLLGEELDAPLPASGPGWRALGQDLELQGRVGAAVRVYAAAVVDGDARAREELDALGVATDTLLRGLQALDEDPQTARPDASAAEGAARQLMAEAEDGQVEAVRALGRMLRQGRLSEHTAARVRARLVAAVGDPRPAVQEAARDGLVEAELADLLLH